MLRAVRPTRWHGSKVDAIVLWRDFVWIDDDPLLAEVEALRKRGLLNRLLIVDSDEDLLTVMKRRDVLHNAERQI